MITKEYNQKMLEATRDEAKKQYHLRLQRINEINKEIQQSITEEDNTTIHRITEKSREHKTRPRRND